MSHDYAFLRGLSAYEVLNVSEQASDEEIHLAYRRMIAQNHPDRAGSALFAQLLNDAKHVLLNDRAAYDAWRRATVDPAANNWPPPPSNGHSAPAPSGPRYVPTDGRPPYFVPPGAFPVRPPAAVPQPNRPGGPRTALRNPAHATAFGPERLSGRMRQLAEQAQRDLFAVFGAATSDTQRETYIRTADLLAALRFYRDIVAPAFTDDMLSAGLAARPADFLHQIIDHYRRAPQSAERDQAISVIVDVDQSSSAGVLVAMVRLTIEKLAGRA